MGKMRLFEPRTSYLIANGDGWQRSNLKVHAVESRFAAKKVESSMPNRRYFAFIPAAGTGARLGAPLPKQYLQLLDKTILQHTVAAFINCRQISTTVLVVSPEDRWIEQIFPTLPVNLRILRCGGATRAQTVQNGMQAMADEIDAQDWVLVHDAARPGIRSDMITQLIAALRDDAVGGLLALPVVDTVKRSASFEDGTLDGLAQVLETVPRQDLWLAQTPQMFRFQLLRTALQDCADNPSITDEASAIEALGLRAKLVPGHPCNLKVTLPTDIPIAEMYLRFAAQQNQHQ